MIRPDIATEPDSSLGPRAPGEVVVTGVWRAFGGTQVLRNAGFTLQGGTVAALIGANGSGKTTILRMLAGVLEADRGTVRVLRQPPGRGLASYVPVGDRGLFWRLTGQQNLEFFSRLAVRDRLEVARRIEFVSGLLGATEFMTRRVGVCSTGQRRRLALARGFVTGSPVVLLDEPFADLDEPGCAAVSELARRWAERGGIVLYASPTSEGGPPADAVLAMEDLRMDPSAPGQEANPDGGSLA